MRAGTLRFRGILETPTPTRDALGAVSDAWAPHPIGTTGKFWFSLKPVSTTETNRADQSEALGRYELRCRYIKRANAGMRVTWGDRTLNIEGVQNVDELNHEMLMFVREDVA